MNRRLDLAIVFQEDANKRQQTSVNSSGLLSKLKRPTTISTDLVTYHCSTTTVIPNQCAIIHRSDLEREHVFPRRSSIEKCDRFVPIPEEFNVDQQEIPQSNANEMILTTSNLSFC